MQRVEWTDELGRKRCRLVRDALEDPLEGLPLEPPDVDRMDWERIMRELGDTLGRVVTRAYMLPWTDIRTALHNQLMDRGLLETRDVQLCPGSFRGAILSAMKPLLSVSRLGVPETNDAIFAVCRRPLLDLYREHLQRG